MDRKVVQERSGLMFAEFLRVPKAFVSDARRYARLLIEDIVLYHPEKVDEGRAHRNLLARLNDEIARARQAYNQRVSESVRAQGDFFEEALVRVLAGGNPEALGTPEPQAP